MLGDDNIFLFGLKADEVQEMLRRGYNPHEYYIQNPILKAVIDQLSAGFDDHVSYSELAKGLLFGAGGPADQYLLLADFESYRAAQETAGRVYQDPTAWNRMSLYNIARSGIFAADRSVAEYAENIWKVPHK